VAWSYDPGLSTDKDKARFYVGDTDEAYQLLSNEELTALVTLEGGPLKAAIAALEHLAAKFSRQADTNITDLAVSASQRASAFAQRAIELRKRTRRLAGIFVGGVSKSTEPGLIADADAKPPMFKRGQDDYPGGAA
jgi:hypothetical protein